MLQKLRNNSFILGTSPTSKYGAFYSSPNTKLATAPGTFEYVSPRSKDFTLKIPENRQNIQEAFKINLPFNRKFGFTKFGPKGSSPNAPNAPNTDPNLFANPSTPLGLNKKRWCN